MQPHGRTKSRAGPARRASAGLPPARRCAVVLTAAMLCLAGSPAGSSSTHKIRFVTSGGTTFLYLRDVASYYGMAFIPGTTRVRLRSKWSQLIFDVGRRKSSINGLSVHLSDAPWIRRGEPLLADHDFRLILDPILRSKTLKQRAVRRVLIDPGHGGKDPGALGRIYQEKAVTLEIGKRLASALKAHGYSVALTRYGDSDLSLAARARKARTWNADVLISLHCNAVGASEVHGVEVFRVTPKGGKSTYSNRRASSSCTNNSWDLNNCRLAYELQKSIVKTTDATDRGMKNARFLVLRESSCPAVLVEMGFLSNASEERRLGSRSYQDKLVDGMVDGVIRYDQSLRSQ